MKYKFKNLVFEGGGILGIAYLGASQILDEKGILKNIERVTGTSAGAIYAVITALNYSVTEMSDILWKTNFSSFTDDTLGLIRDIDRLLTEYGWYKGDIFLNWIKNIIEQKTNNAEITFAQLEEIKKNYNFRSIYLIGSNLSTGFSEIFSAETTPNMPLAEAVRISMSIPLFFTSQKNNIGDIYVDGGIQCNYPIQLFDHNKYYSPNSDMKNSTNNILTINNQNNLKTNYVCNPETLGFRLSSKKQIDVFWDKKEPTHINIQNIFDYLKQLISAFTELQSDIHLHSDDWERTIYIDTLGLSAIDFNLEDDKKTLLIESGKQGALNYFDWFDKK